MPTTIARHLSGAAISLMGMVAASAGAALAAEPTAVGVTINWQALDALPPAPADLASQGIVHLRPPPEPKLAAAPAVVRPAPPAPKPPPLFRAATPPPSAASVTPPHRATPAALEPALPAGRIGMIPFGKGETEIPQSQASILDSIAQKLAGDETARLELVAYATGTPDDPLAARRISLTRAVQMRAYLMGKGVSSVRMDVRALGDRGAGDGPADRVDLVVVQR